MLLIYFAFLSDISGNAILLVSNVGGRSLLQFLKSDAVVFSFNVTWFSLLTTSSPEFLIGIRNLVDALFNQMIVRGSLNNNPPIITPDQHDPDESPFGPRVTWATPNPQGYRVLELPKSEQIEFVKLEFLMAMVQKLFGVTDFVPPSAADSQRTATGILTIVGEGNIKFDDMIRALQDVNADLYDFMVQLNADFMTDDFLFMISDTQENPFKKVTKEDWAGNFDFESAGNSININREVEINKAQSSFITMRDSKRVLPGIITDDVMRQSLLNYNRALDIRNIKVPTSEEMKKQRINEMALAINQAEQLKLQGGAGGGQNAIASGGAGG